MNSFKERLDGHPYKRRRRRGFVTSRKARLFVLLTLAIQHCSIDAFLVHNPRLAVVLSQIKGLPDPFPSNKREHRHSLRQTRLWSDQRRRSDTDAAISNSFNDRNNITSTAAAAAASSTASSYWFSPEQVEQLKQSVNIVDVVESYQLPGFQRKGGGDTQRAVAICPFHDDHNPSLNIDNQRKLYKCFACGAGGDVFNFVKEYDNLGKSEANKMSFGAAVRHVAKEFGDGTSSLQGEAIRGSNRQQRMTEEQRHELQQKQNRIRLANTLAAEFYGKCLVTLPAAGAARQHLRDRHLAPATVRAFAMGYAPDAYFGHDRKRDWGEGSLVEYLRQKGFRPQELIDAGLATRTKRAQWQDVADNDETARQGKVDSHITQTNNTTEPAADDYSTLIDRFRGRLMVPIFDLSGTHVIAFGGRILAAEAESAHSEFKAPKYLNSPESLVFQKKNELFGLHYACQAIREQTQRSTILIVEGYMDAIALWDIGVHEVVASMGTALTMEQLSAAAKAVGSRGQIVLCMDNDEAGVSAIERLCGGALLEKIAETSVVEIKAASLPTGIKDPADFIETIRMGTKSGIDTRFRKDVVNESIDWADWYLKLLLSRYDPKALRGSSGSFGDICDRISEFLSTFPNPADRIQRAHDVAGSLAKTIANNSEDGKVSSALRIQLESDLVNMVARKVNVKQSVERRIESVDGVSPQQTSGTLARMVKGDISSTPETDESKLSSRALRSRAHDTPAKSATKREGRNKATSRRGPRPRIRRSSTARKSLDPSLTPHFSGFEFANKSDADWLGLPREKWKRKKENLTLGSTTDLSESSSKAYREPIYFNSNAFHGLHFLTEDALEAGYRNGKVPRRDASFLEHGIGSLITQDVEAIVTAAEDKLLRCLVEHASARDAMKAALQTSDATGARGRIEWTSPERQWLFSCLVEKGTEIPGKLLSTGNMEHLRDYFAGRKDAPHGAFGLNRQCSADDILSPVKEEHIIDPVTQDRGKDDPLAVEGHPWNGASSSTPESHANVPSDVSDIEKWAATYDPEIFDPEETSGIGPVDSKAPPVDSVTLPFVSGTLDKYFAREEDIFADTYDQTVSRQLRAELEVQESLATLLKASALKQISSIKQAYTEATQALSSRNVVQTNITLGGPTNEGENGGNQLDLMTTEDLTAYCESLGRRLRDLIETAHHLHQSAKRIGSRLLDYSNAEGLEGRLSIALQEQLASAIDDFVENLPQLLLNQSISTTATDRRYHYNIDPAFGWRDSDEDQEEALVQDMARINEEWGHWSNDDYKWSQDDAGDRKFWAKDGTNEVELPFMALDDPEDDESVTAILSRIDAEWGDWSRDDADSSVYPSAASDAARQDVSVVSEDSLTNEEQNDVNFDSIFE